MGLLILEVQQTTGLALMPETLIVGGAEVDLASVAVSAAVFVFDATNASFAWPGNQTKCWLLRFRVLVVEVREVAERMAAQQRSQGGTTLSSGIGTWKRHYTD